MKNNKNVETAQKGQTTTKNTQPENVKNDLKKIQEHRDAKKSKTPTGKVTLLKETEARKKARKEQYDNFRINALKRRCKRMTGYVPQERRRSSKTGSQEGEFGIQDAW